MSLSKFAQLAFVALLLTGCSTTYESTWVDSEVQRPLHLAGEKIAVFAMGANQMTGRAVESQLAERISENGAVGVAGYDLVPVSQREDREQGLRKLADEDIKGAIVLRVVGEKERTRYVPGQTYYSANRYNSFSGYWGGFGVAWQDPGHYEVDRLVYVETLYYSVPDDKLVWGGVSRTTNPSNLARVLDKLARDTATEMREAGLIGTGG